MKWRPSRLISFKTDAVTRNRELLVFSSEVMEEDRGQCKRLE
jgi:hypothetical protein